MRREGPDETRQDEGVGGELRATPLPTQIMSLVSDCFES